MKKLTLLLGSVALAAMLAIGAACAQPKTVQVDETPVIITPDSKVLEITENTTLADYMNELAKRGELSFKANDGMISEMNGKANAADWSSSWMLYTDDKDNSNAAWGTAEYKGISYESAALGYAALKIKAGCTYIWIYQSFNV